MWEGQAPGGYLCPGYQYHPTWQIWEAELAYYFQPVLWNGWGMGAGVGAGYPAAGIGGWGYQPQWNLPNCRWFR